MLTIQNVVDIVSNLKDTCSIKITVNPYGICHLWSKKYYNCIWTYHGFWGDSDAAEYQEETEPVQEE